MKNKNQKPKDYRPIFPKDPFVFNKDGRATSIKCPSCQEGFLEIKYTKNGGNFVCVCGFELK